MLYSRFVLPSSRTRAHVAFTDRWGGFSSTPFSTLNLALHVGDDDTDVVANRGVLANTLGLNPEALRFIDQVHGNRVIAWDADGAHDPHTGERAESLTADAHVTKTPGLGLVIMVADCVPVMFADPEVGVIGAAHAGRAGMVNGVVPATVAAMRELGASKIQVAIGPSICPRCYEVPADMRAQVSSVEPVTASVSRDGTPALDVAAGVAEQAAREGCEIVDFSSTCTRESSDLFSYRKDSITGRFGGLVWLEELTTHPRKDA